MCQFVCNHCALSVVSAHTAIKLQCSIYLLFLDINVKSDFNLYFIFEGHLKCIVIKFIVLYFMQRGVVEVQSRVGDLLDLEGCAGGVATALHQEGVW